MCFFGGAGAQCTLVTIPLVVVHAPPAGVAWCAAPCALRALSPHAVDRHGCSPHPPASVYPRLYMIALLQYGIALRVPLDLNILSPT